MLLPFVGDAYKVQSPNLNAQTCINLYPVLDAQGGKSVSALYRTPGLTLFSDDNDEHKSTRGLFKLNDELYQVADDIFYRVDALGVKYQLGVLKTSVGRVSIISNGLQIGIFDGPNGYTYTFVTGVFADITSPGFQGCNFAAYQDGYGILPEPNTEKWYLTNLFDFGTIDPLDFASTNQTPDRLRSAISTNQEVWFFNDISTETWYDLGAEIFPFARRQTLTIQYGIAALFSIVKAANSNLFWLAINENSQGVICRLNGYNPTVISTDAVNFAINQYPVIDDAFGFAYEDDGHLFYVLTFPTADRTWVYDVTTSLWHERRSQINNEEPFVFPTRQGRWRPNCYAMFNGKHIVGDFESGKLFYIDTNNFTENGTTITWERTAYHLSKDEQYINCSNFQLIIQSGVGLNTGQGSDPQVMLQVSKDFAHTFGPEMWRSMGKQGQFKYRALWPALGIARDWVWRVRGTDPTQVAILNARADLG